MKTEKTYIEIISFEITLHDYIQIDICCDSLKHAI